MEDATPRDCKCRCKCRRKTHLSLQTQDVGIFNHLGQDGVPFRGFADEGIDLSRFGSEIAGAVDARFEGATRGWCGQDGLRIEVEGHLSKSWVGRNLGLGLTEGGLK